ncbi:hypothetical protein AVEN_187467-1 [Araneus ventricosus]|uniref:Granulins domain-containing protein n=1 Tax=Araneus ventricosus TaxID=182803 RepID=A0A4Y2BSM5_ARAVE|nr:hypothetical protein AVEN_187467-1 [Araneus ventricosus]
MLLEPVVLLVGIVSVLGNGCSDVCEPTDTCCPGPNQSEANCCPFENAVCCEDGIHCCPEGSFCDLDMRMCGLIAYPQVMRKRTGDIEEEITIDSSTRQREKRDTIEQSYMNEITHIDHMLVHCDLNQFCPYFSTCCRMKEDNISLCCPNPEGVCCSDEEHCCKQGEECDSRGVFCLSDIGLETMVRKANVLKYHYEKRGLDFVEPYAIKGKPSNHSE